MAGRPPGRRTESLFDNRYRYDHIFPRGRSGETLRAYDTRDNDRPVVVKRPAPQDAPPMRAGQEVSIRTEKQALERLAGHRVLTELRGAGTFRVGGNTHDYIVMDLAEGQIVEDMVLELAEHGAFLPELETLVIMDNLLDLLSAAHDKQIVYNDVDAKHLFWDRATYRLKVIDWGNAVFLDEPGALPSVNYATDIYQCGELLYFILTGGNRLVTQVEDGETFFVNFGAATERIPPRLQSILTHTVAPDAKRRYGTIRELRQALADYRQPLAKERDDIISRVRKRVRATASQEELIELHDMLQDALDMDPGCPDALKLADEIDRYVNQIRIQADLDAIRIYLESGNWTRALSLLHELLPGADPLYEPLVRFLIEASATLEHMRVTPPPAGFLGALDALFEGDHAAAGRILLTTAEQRPSAYQSQWLLAEQLATLMPEVTLLRPHLVRLRRDLEGEERARRAFHLLAEAEDQLNSQPLPGLAGLQVTYQQTADRLRRLEETLETLASTPEREAWLATAIRAQRAAQEIVHRLEEVGHHAFSDPSQAGDLLYTATAVDPTSPHFAALNSYFDEVHQAVGALQQFRPRPDGSNLATWFADVADFLQPYLDDLPDEQLHAAADAVRRAGENWTVVVNYLALGRRQPTIDLLRVTADMVRPFNEQLAAWMGAFGGRLPDAPYVERHSPNQPLADLLIDGWKAWDQGKGLQAAELGDRAHDKATTDGERLAAQRLQRLGELLDGWVSGGGSTDAARTDQAETETLAVLLSDEENERRTFAEQMPNTALYLRAMGRGIVAYMEQSSSAGWRALYLHYVLRGMLALLDDEMDEAEFWRSVASKAYEDAKTHSAYQLLDRRLTVRRLIQGAEGALNNVSGPNDLEAVRQTLNAPLAGEVLTGASNAIQSIHSALRAWSDGDFHVVYQALNVAQQDMQTAVNAADLHIQPFMDWLNKLHEASAELHQARLTLDQAAMSASETPDPAVAETHGRIVHLTLDALGPDYAHQVRQWQDMYEAVLETYTTRRLTRQEKLASFSRHFASLFISKHPMYPLFRRWEEYTEQMPVDEPEDDVIQMEAARAPVDELTIVTFVEDDAEALDVAPEREEAPAEGGLPWNRIIIGALLVLVVAIALAAWRHSTNEPNNEDDSNPGGAPVDDQVPASLIGSPTALPMLTDAPTAVAAVALVDPTLTEVPTDVPTDIPTDVPTPEPTATVPSATPAPPTPEPTTAEPPTDVPSATPEPAITESAEAVVQPTDVLGVTNTPPPSPEPPTFTPLPPTPTAPPVPENPVLTTLADVPPGERPWPVGAIAQDPDGVWRLSTAGTASDQLMLELTPELLGSLFQPGAANALIRVEMVVKLVDYDAASLAAGNVVVGLGAMNERGEFAIGQVRYEAPTFISWEINQNDSLLPGTSFPLPAEEQEITLSIRRENANTFGFYINGKSRKAPVVFFVERRPVTPLVYVAGQDVIVEISALEFGFSPSDELP